MSTLSNKVALVTGGSRGIGAGIVKRLAADGANVAFTFSSNQAAADALVTEIEKLGIRAIAIKADSASAQAVASAVETTVSAFGRLDILVNNAGTAVWGSPEETSLEDFDKMLNINVRAHFVAIKAASKHLTSGGRIINIGSINADRMPFARGGVYAMTKAAVQGMTRGFARDFGPLGITINNIQPGPVNTELNPEAGEFADYLRTLMSVPRYGQADEIGAMVSYLVGPESGFINGASLDIDGGFGN
jgi:3-oxoacyl-[acyl-carrier protein] reductase